MRATLRGIELEHRPSNNSLRSEKRLTGAGALPGCPLLRAASASAHRPLSTTSRATFARFWQLSLPSPRPCLLVFPRPRPFADWTQGGQGFAGPCCPRTAQPAGNLSPVYTRSSHFPLGCTSCRCAACLRLARGSLGGANWARPPFERGSAGVGPTADPLRRRCAPLAAFSSAARFLFCGCPKGRGVSRGRRGRGHLLI
jgi:hypothetical protein